MAESVLSIDSLICAQLSQRAVEYAARHTGDIFLSPMITNSCRQNATGKRIDSSINKTLLIYELHFVNRYGLDAINPIERKLGGSMRQLRYLRFSSKLNVRFSAGT